VRGRLDLEGFGARVCRWGPTHSREHSNAWEVRCRNKTGAVLFPKGSAWWIPTDTRSAPSFSGGVTGGTPASVAGGFQAEPFAKCALN